MAQRAIAGENEEEGTELLLLVPGAGGGGGGDGGGDLEREPSSWRLNFGGLRPSEEHKEKPPRGLQDCLGVRGTVIFFIFI